MGINTSKYILGVLFISIFFSGCSTNYVIKPDVTVKTDKKPLQTIEGKIEYKKENKAYLPKSIKSVNKSKYRFKYDYNVIYNNGSIDGDIVHAFINPLLIVGYPLSNSSLIVTAQLDIIKYSKSIKSYKSVCIAKSARSLLNNTNLSKDRRECINKVRYNIDVQIQNSIYKGEL